MNEITSQTGGVTRTLSYDLNGSITSDGGTRTFEWDGANRLVAINYTGFTTRSEWSRWEASDIDGKGERPNEWERMSQFTYDGLNRVAKVVEKTGATINSTRKFVWAGQEKLEFRDVTDAVTQRNYGQGQYVGTTAYFYTRDHLGSIREMFTGGGTVVARYDYDPYGRSTTVLGTTPTDFNFTGLYRHSKSNLDLAVFRAYDPDLGRWLNRDPIDEKGGLNLYRYVDNNPANSIDPLGLFNPTKGLSALLNVVNAGRLAGAGLVRLGIGELLTDTGVGAPPGGVTMAVGTWNMWGSHAAWNRAQKQWNEAFEQSWSELSMRNLLGVLPFGTEYDDPCEPSMSDVFKRKLEEAKERPGEIIREIGTLGP